MVCECECCALILSRIERLNMFVLCCNNCRTLRFCTKLSLCTRIWRSPNPLAPDLAPLPSKRHLGYIWGPDLEALKWGPGT